jgi:hypothetical protein
MKRGISSSVPAMARVVEKHNIMAYPIPSNKSGVRMAVVEFDYHGRTYRVDLPHYDSKNIHSINLIRGKITLSEDTITGERILVSWSDIAIMRIIS